MAQVKRSPFYNAQDVMEFLGCKQNYAYTLIRKLRNELVDMGKEPGPAGKISKKYFREKFYCDEQDFPDYSAEEVRK